MCSNFLSTLSALINLNKSQAPSSDWDSGIIQVNSPLFLLRLKHLVIFIKSGYILWTFVVTKSFQPWKS